MTRATTVSGNAAAVAGARMAGEERRLQILQVAMRLFSQRGFRGTTTKEIALAAGVSEAMVFRHFATKEELYSAILDYKACFGGMENPHVLLADAVAGRDDCAVFERLAVTVMCYHERDPEFLRLLTHAALEGHRLAEMFWQTTVRETYKLLGGYIRRRQRDGAFRSIDPLIAVRAFIGMVIHHSMANNIWDKSRHLLNISNERAAKQFTEILLQGILKAASPKSRVERRRKPRGRVPGGGRKKSV